MFGKEITGSTVKSKLPNSLPLLSRYFITTEVSLYHPWHPGRVISPTFSISSLIPFSYSSSTASPTLRLCSDAGPSAADSIPSSHRLTPSSSASTASSPTPILPFPTGFHSSPPYFTPCSALSLISSRFRPPGNRRRPHLILLLRSSSASIPSRICGSSSLAGIYASRRELPSSG